MTRSGIFSIGSVLLGALSGCGEKPTRIDVGGLTQTFANPVLSADPVPLHADVLGESGKPVDGVDLSWSVVPAGIATVTDSALTCLKGGDAAVVVAGGGLTETVPMRCRIVAKIQAPDTLALVIGDPPTPLQLVALDPDGKPLTDVAVQARPADAAMA